MSVSDGEDIVEFVRTKLPAWPALLAILLLLSQPVAASDDKKASREREQIRRLQQAQRDLEQERNRLQQEKTQLEAQFNEVGEKLTGAEKNLASATRRNALLSKELASAKTELGATTQKLEETGQREKDTAARLATAEGENRKLQAELRASQNDAATCEAKNVALYLRGRELLAKIEGQSALDRLLAAEPLFGIKGVEIENTVQEYRDKLEAEKYQRRATAN